jgi:hypothetical protein
MFENLTLLLNLFTVLLMLGFGLFCGVNLVQLIYEHAKIWQAATRSKTWLITDGHIVDVTLRNVGNRRFSWEPIIIYKYRVNGVEYQGHRLWFKYFNKYSLAGANEIMERFAVKTPVKVFYDPEQPQESTLEQAHRGLIWGLLFLPFLLFLPTAMCICAGLLGLADIWKK